MEANAVAALDSFFRKWGIDVKAGINFRLDELILDIASKAITVAEFRGKITELTKDLDPDSGEWGGCPNCGSDVHMAYTNCPFCGYLISAAEDDSSFVEGYVSDQEQNQELNDVKIESVKTPDCPPIQASGTTDVLTPPKDGLVPVQSRQKQSKEKKNPSMTPEKRAEKARRRESLKDLLPDLIKNPEAAFQLKYDDLLMLPAMLGYPQTPTTIGKKHAVQNWVYEALKQRSSLKKRTRR